MQASPDPVTATRLAYERSAESWTRAAADRTGFADSYDTFAAAVGAGRLVLDLGCGAGHDAPGLAARGLRLVGLDIAPTLLATAKRQPALAGLLALGDLRSLPFRDRAFDGVWTVGTLHHVPKADLPAALRARRRVVRLGRTRCRRRQYCNSWRAFVSDCHAPEPALSLPRCLGLVGSGAPHQPFGVGGETRTAAAA